MSNSDDDSLGHSAPRLDLAEISTRWSSIQDPHRFVLRYSRAIRAYLATLIRNEADVDDVSQDFLHHFIARGLPRVDQARGRFRDYLKVAVRNTAMSHLRKNRATQMSDEQWRAVEDGIVSQAEQAWTDEWKKCLLERIWRSVETYEAQHQGSLVATVLRIHLDHHEQEDSTELARRLSEKVGRTVRPDAFRKQLSRARKLYGELLIAEVRQTLESPTRDRVEEELAELGLLDRLRSLLEDSAADDDED